METKKILICVPAGDQVATAFASSLATLDRVGETGIAFKIGSLVYEARDELAKKAVELGTDYTMWFDSDMTFGRDTLQRMARHMDNGIDIVTGLAFRRVPPYTPTIFSELEIEGGEASRCADYNDYPDEMFEIAGCGFACAMVRTEVFVNVCLEHRQIFSPIGHVGEDLAFCWRARKCGYKIWCDPTIKTGHCGHTVITEGFYRSYQQSKAREG